MKAFSIKDKKSEGFNTPFFQLTFGQAERSFKDAASDEKNPIHKHKEDYSLWFIGDFNANTGVITPRNEPELICNAE